MHRAILDCNNWIGDRGIHVFHSLEGLHSLGVNPEALQHIASTFPASSLALATAVWPIAAGCFVPRWPHDLQALT